jgi:hypothetical protein
MIRQLATRGGNRTSKTLDRIKKLWLKISLADKLRFIDWLICGGDGVIDIRPMKEKRSE